MLVLAPTYEQSERDALFGMASPSDVFFDVGANDGLYSIDFATRFPRGRAYAFEPIPNILAILRTNCGDLPNITICPYGLSDATSTRTLFYYSPLDSGATSLAPLEVDRFGITDIIESPVIPIDSICSIDLFPSLMKIDVEGAEMMVLRGAEDTLAQHHPILMVEMLRKWSRRFNYHPNDTMDFLAMLGYRCFVLRSGTLQPFQKMTDETVDTNFFFLHPSHKEFQ